MKHTDKIPDCLLSAGAVMVSVGVGWVLCPAIGLIAAGVFCIAGGILLAVGGGET